MENVSLVMAGAQLGITICSVGLGAVGEPAVAHLLEPLFDAAHVPDNLLHPVSFAVALSIVVYLHVVLGEMVPKNIALAGPERAAIMLGPPMMAVVTVLGPVIAGELARRCRQRAGLGRRADRRCPGGAVGPRAMINAAKADGQIDGTASSSLPRMLFISVPSI